MQELLQLGQLVYIISSSADNVKFVFSFLGQKFRPENIYCEQCQWNHSSAIV